mmetsp:Transcript_61328/g.131862  ORF Transcript_61328/g.131862 Transcript_61328/m.131862 type:complete len:272 (-) Transcript_61328:976-1791(-)
MAGMSAIDPIRRKSASTAPLTRREQGVDRRVHSPAVLRECPQASGLVGKTHGCQLTELGCEATALHLGSERVCHKVLGRRRGRLLWKACCRCAHACAHAAKSSSHAAAHQLLRQLHHRLHLSRVAHHLLHHRSHRVGCWGLLRSRLRRWHAKHGSQEGVCSRCTQGSRRRSRRSSGQCSIRRSSSRRCCSGRCSSGRRSQVAHAAAHAAHELLRQAHHLLHLLRIAHHLLHHRCHGVGACSWGSRSCRPRGGSAHHLLHHRCHGVGPGHTW